MGKKRKKKKSKYLKIKKADMPWYILIVGVIGMFIGWLLMLILFYFMIS